MTKPKLLLADDSVTIRKVVELTFADEGIDVSTVADADSAMQRFVEIQPDIVLVDVGLDGTNGYQICEMIKADDATKHIPVMLLVGSFEPFDHDEANRVGADGFLTKPFNSIRDLVSRVRMLLDRDATDLAAKAPSVEDQNPSLDESYVPTPETEDIHQLYQSSFGETETDGFETVDDLLGDAGMDDDMIEASYAVPSSTDELVEAEPTEQIKQFDWSLDSKVTEDDYRRDSPVIEQANSPGELYTADSIRGDNSGQTGTDPDVAGMDTIEISHAPNLVNELRSSMSVEEEEDDVIELLGDDEDWMADPASRSEATEDDLISFSDVDPAIHETIPYEIGESSPVLKTEGDSHEVSTELIEKIVRQVIAKLSDEVVREIARVEVPRITEKLIREALQEENKN